jgi:hypothetical protein
MRCCAIICALRVIQPLNSEVCGALQELADDAMSVFEQPRCAAPSPVLLSTQTLLTVSPTDRCHANLNDRCDQMAQTLPSESRIYDALFKRDSGAMNTQHLCRRGHGAVNSSRPFRASAGTSAGSMTNPRLTRSQSKANLNTKLNANSHE